MPHAAAPERIGPYVIEATLGRGAMGVVYLARDERIGRRVALKKIDRKSPSAGTSPASAESSRRLQREAEICGSMHHPNIVTLLDVGYEGNRISYLAMEYVPGDSLTETIRRYAPGPVPLDDAIRLTGDVLRGLAYAHGKGIVHRDIKPANILVGHDGAKIADFGIARPEQSDMTIAGTLMGTPNYMSPEQAKGAQATPRSDLFSVGVVMLEMLSGKKPFATGDAASTIQNIISMPTPSLSELNPEVPAGYDRFIQRLTAKVAEERFPSAETSLDELERLQGGGGIESVTVSPHESAEPTWPAVVLAAMRRPISAALFWVVVFAATVAAVTPIGMIWRACREAPVQRISPERLREFARKREQLRQADLLSRGGKYDQSLKIYKDYLARYPRSTVASDGAEKARKALRPAPGRRRKSEERSPLEHFKKEIKKIFRNP